MGSEVIVDNFLKDFPALRSHCDTVSYEGMTSSVDNVFYDGVSVDIPNEVSLEVVERVEGITGCKITNNFMFLRLSVAGVNAPHGAHTDSSMGKYSLMLYLNINDDCLGGTSFVIHNKTGLFETPINDAQTEIWRRDTNNFDDWSVLSMCGMQENRGLIFEAEKMHRALPVGGFGSGAKDGRLVLTMFFDVND